MSPEQAMGERDITARSDVYALGAVVYEMLTGEPPFTGATVQQVVAKVLTEKPAPIVSRGERVRPHVEEAVDGYRRLTWQMLDAGVAALSESSVYRILTQSGSPVAVEAFAFTWPRPTGGR